MNRSSAPGKCLPYLTIEEPNDANLLGICEVRLSDLASTLFTLSYLGTLAYHVVGKLLEYILIRV